MVKEKIDNLDQLLNGLCSDLGRAELIYQLFTNGKDIPRNHLHIAVEFYEKARRYNKAGYLARELGMDERAIEFYERSGMDVDAADFAKRLGMDERANQLYSKVIGAYEDIGYYYGATQLAKRVGMHDKVELYKTIEKLLK